MTAAGGYAADGIGADLGVSGDSFLFTPPSDTATSIGVSLEGATDLLANAPWTADALAFDHADTDGVQHWIPAGSGDGEASPSRAFARLVFTRAW